MQVIQGGQLEFNSLAYGDHHPNTLRFLQEQVSQGFQNTLGTLGQTLNENLVRMYDMYNGIDAQRLMKTARRKLTGLFEHDVIRPLFSTQELQQATMCMQRWIMAEPTLRALYHAQRCDGYSATYIDMHPDSVGNKHYDYRRVMDGFVQVDDEGSMTTTYFYDDVPDEDPELTVHDKVDILNTWDYVRYHLTHKDEDPTSIFGDKL